MNRRTLLGTTLSTLAIAAVLSGCAAGQQIRGSLLGSKADNKNIGLATRAQAALGAQQYVEAIELAERAVENKPNDAGFRSLLGNCYFAAGRFASAEAAYRDSLSLYPSQPKVVLKLALVEIAQGKNADALALLEAARDALDPADYGLAMALAGEPAAAVAVLDEAARAMDSDSRIRQNLALAYGLSGDWTMARTVAEQDVPPEQLDGRIQQWMAMATPSRPSDQVAALTGVTPAADPGQPVRLALNKAALETEAQAQAAVPQIQPEPRPQTQQVADIPAAPPPALAEPSPAVAEVAAAEPAVAEAVQTLIQPEPQQPVAVGEPVVPAVAARAVPELPTRFDAPVQPASYVAISDTVRRAAEQNRRANGKARSVVQLGAYRSPDRVMLAWNQITKKYPALGKYTPMRARFDGPGGTVWRLSIKGFASRQEAAARCELLQSRGGSCFVRTVAGDSPVQLASR
jgi:D-alanyl-D-alanine carboxypeptidase